jgi:hypothetical protein
VRERILLFIVIVVLAAGSAYADSITYYFNPTGTFSGDAPIGSLSATFTDNNGGVLLNITSALYSSSTRQENLDPNKALYLNFNPYKDLYRLNFNLISNTGFNQQTVAHYGLNEFKADGTGGYYDILLTYSSGTKAFTNGQSQTYSITLANRSINIRDFQFLSFSAPSYAAVHVQNTGGSHGSGWVSPTPVPPTVWILGSGLLGLIGIRKRMKA